MTKLMIDNMSDERLDQEIEAVYLWWAHERPGVTPRETGYLGDLWAEFDKRRGAER